MESPASFVDRLFRWSQWMSERHGLVPLSFVRIPMRKIPQFPSIQSPKQQITTQAAKKNWQPAHPQKIIQALCVAFPVQNICKPKFIESALGIRSLTLRSRRLITRIVNCYWKNQAKILTPTTSQSDWLRDSRSTQWARAEYKRPRPAGWWMVFRGCRWTEAAKWDVWMSLMAKYS